MPNRKQRNSTAKASIGFTVTAAILIPLGLQIITESNPDSGAGVMIGFSIALIGVGAGAFAVGAMGEAVTTTRTIERRELRNAKRKGKFDSGTSHSLNTSDTHQNAYRGEVKE